ncbi:MAG: hypothetical protein WBE22_08765 [Halobacteriota archaeon]
MAKEIEELIREFLNETEQEDEVENSMCLEDIYTGEKFRTKVTEEGRGWLKICGFLTVSEKHRPYILKLVPID